MHVELRPWTHGDAARLAELADDVDVIRWMTDFPHPYTVSDAHDFIDRAANEQPDQLFAIVVDGVIVGGAGLELLSGASRAGVGILGYWLTKTSWGRGIASEVVRLLANRGFEGGLRRIEASVFSPNVVSAHVLEKNGFVLEGRLRSAYVQRDGTPCDRLIFGRVAPPAP